MPKGCISKNYSEFLELSMRKQNIAKHFANANDYQSHANVQEAICYLLMDKIGHAHQQNIFEVGAGQGQLTQMLQRQLSADNWYINELCPEYKNHLQKIIPTAHLCVGDAENVDFYFSSQKGNQDNLKINIKPSLVISANAIQWFDNPLNFITRARSWLTDNGQLLFSTFTADNFKQIKQLTGQGLYYPSEKQWQTELIKQGFVNIETSVHTFDISFANPRAVLQHIKKTGVSVDTNQSFRWTKSSLAKFIRDYKQLFSGSPLPSNEDESVILTYQALIVNATVVNATVANATKA